MAAHHEVTQDVWYDQHRYEDAEIEYQQYLAQQRCGGRVATGGCPVTCTRPAATETTSHKSSLVNEIVKAREHIQKSLNSDASGSKTDVSLSSRLSTLEVENKQLRQISSELEGVIKRLEGRIVALEKGQSSSSVTPAAVSAVQTNGVAASADDDDDDFELFGDDNEPEDADAERIKLERVKAYEDKKAKKPVLIAKSNIILDVKPWDDETDMAELEKCVRSIEMDGLLWGSSKLVPLAFTIKKLQISCVVEDDKVSTDDLEEKIMAFEDLIQSIDIAAFNKI